MLILSLFRSICTMCYEYGLRAGNRFSGPDFGRVLVGKGSASAAAVAFLRADFGAFPID
jgi:hypothetical protein